MRKLIIGILFLLLLGVAIGAWIFLWNGTGFSSKKETLYIPSNAATKKAVLDSIHANKIVSNEMAFEWLAGRMGYWESIRPGKYEFTKGTSLLTIVRTLRNGTQSPVNLVITKLRTREDFARLVGNRFEIDSSRMIDFLSRPDSLKEFDVTPETVMSIVLPDTYTYLWSAGPKSILQKIHAASKKYWTDERVAKAQALGLTPQQAHIIASIIEEETNYHEEKDTMASVYINRYKKGMPLGADPTIKFALKDFSLKWIGGKSLQVESPYNTYKNKGLPPGPICTPSKKTLDAVLAAPQTDYLFFVANSNFSGSHLFSVTFEEHMKKARAFQEEDNRRHNTRNTENVTK